MSVREGGVPGAAGPEGGIYADSPRPGTPAEALRQLLAGNRRFAEGRATNPNRTVEWLQHLGSNQAPFASVLACADSRVPVEILFDQGFGDVFVTRVAGNIATSEIIGSLEYSVEVLGSELIIVLGHVGCGAVRAAMARVPVPGQIASLFPYIVPAVVESGSQGADAVVSTNVRKQAAILRNASPVIAARIGAGSLAVVGGVLDFHDGLVHMVEYGVLEGEAG
jgi:carbonic anhydrase